jgi:hypothetical protein
LNNRRIKLKISRNSSAISSEFLFRKTSRPACLNFMNRITIHSWGKFEKSSQWNDISWRFWDNFLRCKYHFPSRIARKLRAPKRFFFNRKYIINNNVISVQDEQRSVNEELQNKTPYISGTPMKIPKQTPPKRSLF